MPSMMIIAWTLWHLKKKLERPGLAAIELEGHVHSNATEVLCIEGKSPKLPKRHSQGHN